MQRFRLSSTRRRLSTTRKSWSIGFLLVAVVVSFVGLGGVAYATGGTITVPATNPYAATYDATGNFLSYLTVSGTGFPASTPMYIEQCDGLSPSDPNWDPTINCDLGTSPAPVTSDGSGNVSFSATGASTKFRPFEGASPQQNFNCLGPAQADPANGLPSWTNCQIRVSSSDQTGTADQAFLPMTLPNPSAPAAPTAIKAVSGSDPTPSVPMKVSFVKGSSHGSPITTNTATCTSSNLGTTRTGSAAISPISVSLTTIAKTYTCKVTSTNAIGTSPASLASLAVIEGTPAAPTNVVAKTSSTTNTTGSLIVSFTAGATNGSPLTAPQYTATCTSSNAGVLKTGTAAASPVTVAGVTTAKTYTCAVKAHNARGTGLTSLASLPVIVGSPAPPATPTIANTVSGTLRVTFTPLTAAQANGSPLTAPQYTATCTSSNGGLTKLATGTTSPINVTLLTPGRTYTCTVKAHNARGYGLSSPKSLAHTA